MSRRRIAWGVAANLYDKLLIAGVQLLMVPLLVLHWGLPLYGSWVLLVTIPGFLAVADLGFGGAATLRMIGLVALDKRDEAVVVLQTACQVVAIAAVVVLAGALLTIWAVPAGWLPADPALPVAEVRIILVLLVLYALAVFQSMLAGAAYVSVRLAPLYAFTSAHVTLLESALLAAVVVAGHGPLAGAAAMLTGRVAGVTGQRILLRRREPWLRFGLGRADPAERKLLARSAMGVVTIPLSQALVLQGSVVALGAAAGPIATPAFVAARTLSRIGLQATQLFTHAIMPEFTAAHARTDQAAQARMLVALVGAALLAALPFALLIGLAGDWLLARWTGGAIIAPSGLMPAIALTVALGGLWTPLSAMMLAIGRQGAFVWAYLLIGIASVAGTYSLAQALGATGAALAVAALDLCMCVVVGSFAYRQWWRGFPTGPAARAMLARGLAVMRR
ncbi:MAG: hypothetical protein JWN21_1052 [Sphingomonas bacterium]|uniref:hypothetical protein n=1 Tax=Sphingomonas bacterium TaxID=1895847 RepID=UPI00260272DC|nr:hypothetical protein [Sphingomonas bacterium]MDB5695509.1 hypothetical protein [Sphingomonas bacterium]